MIFLNTRYEVQCLLVTVWVYAEKLNRNKQIGGTYIGRSADIDGKRLDGAPHEARVIHLKPDAIRYAVGHKAIPKLGGYF